MYELLKILLNNYPELSDLIKKYIRNEIILSFSKEQKLVKTDKDFVLNNYEKFKNRWNQLERISE